VDLLVIYQVLSLEPLELVDAQLLSSLELETFVEEMLAFNALLD